MGHGTYSYKPTNAFTKWLDSRLPIVRFVDEHLMQFPTPKNLNYWYTFGGILAFMLGVQIISGIVLAMHYVPHEAQAFDSVERIMRDVNYGWLIRYIHSNGASMFFIAVYIHIFRGLYYGSYKAPREVLWILGVIIYLLMMATGFLGYTLPWGQMSFWGATVITNFFSAIPLVGQSITEWLWGSFAVDNSTLQRFFSLHYLLPFVIAGVVVLHIWALHVPGNNNPLGIDVKGPADTVAFHPYYTTKDGFGLAVFVLFFALFIFFAPNFLGHPDNYIEANRLVTPPHIVPEWYYLPFYAILRSVPDILFIPSKLAGVIALFASILVLAFLPWLDTSSVRSAKFRPIFRQVFWIFVAVCLGLGWVGAQSPDMVLVDMGADTDAIESGVKAATDAGKPAAEIEVIRKSLEASERVSIDVVDLGLTLTIAYFAFFLVVLPLLGLLETPLPVPESISKAVLAKKGGAAAPAAAE
jgi:quinol-cytochrome oxidoreductase complex cytochrome b subunit